MTDLWLMHNVATGTVQLVTKRAENSFAWYVIRGAGLVAAALLILLMLSGIGQVTGLTYRFMEPVKAWTIHKAMAFALAFSVFIHVTFLLFDHYVSFKLPQILLPFASHYSNKTTFGGLALGWFAVTFGVLAMYGVVIIILSSLGLIDRKRKTWRSLHYLSYAVFFLIFLHGLFAGSDLRYGVFRSAWILGSLIVLLGVISRLRRAGSLRDPTDTD